VKTMRKTRLQFSVPPSLFDEFMRLADRMMTDPAGLLAILIRDHRVLAKQQEPKLRGRPALKTKPVSEAARRRLLREEQEAFDEGVRARAATEANRVREIEDWKRYHSPAAEAARLQLLKDVEPDEEVAKDALQRALQDLLKS